MVAMVAAMFGACPAHALPACAPSASIKPFDYPGERAIPTTNNLMLPTGKAIPAAGQELLIEGQVLDQHCAPVAEAVVELWQASPFGRYLLAGPEQIAEVAPTFAGAGRTYTDHAGRFTFVTAFPGPNRYAAPNLNFRVKAAGFTTYTTAMFFDNDARNAADKTYGALSPTARKDTRIVVEGQGIENGPLHGSVRIVLSGSAPYRAY